ncbi:PAS domain S-box protein [Paenisporosarcina quisquiliarum]|uniref:PAS domain S-box protein n=1 Tax=Paenisporosarcina quisquiliarum TaxID=365346 RepID=UPI003735233D
MNVPFFSKTQFDLLYGNSKDLVFFLKQDDQTFRYIYVNPSARLIFKECPIKRLLQEMVSTEHLNDIQSNYLKAIDEQTETTFQDFFLFSDVQLVNETTVKPILFEGQQYILAITKEVSVEKEIEEKYAFMQSLLSMTVDPTIVVTNEGKIFDMNPKFEDVFGYTLKDWRGKHYLNFPFIPSDERNSVESHVESNLKGEAKSSVLVKRMKSSGDVGTFLVSYSPIRKDGQVVAMYILLQEVSDELELKESLRNTRHILESYKRAISTAAMVIMINPTGKIDYVNELFVDVTGYKRDEIIGKPFQTLNTNRQGSDFLNTLWDTLLSEKIWRGEMRNQTKFGSVYWGDTTVIPLFNEHNELENILVFQFDITDKKSVMTELRNIEKTFKLITENTNDLIAITSDDGMVLYTSPSHDKLLNFENEQMLGRFYSEMVAEEDQHLWNEELFERLNSGEEMRFEMRLKRTNGELIWTETSIIAVQDADREKVFQHVIVSREISERKKLEERLRFMAYHDNLTQLPNRSFLLKEFPDLVQKANQLESSIAVLYLDGDDFKSVNDEFGHDIGDEFIRHFGIALQASVRTEDLVARIGGDEFVILINNVSKNPNEQKLQITSIIDRIQTSLKEGWKIKNTSFTPTSSIGIAFYPEHGATIDELLEKADVALYEVKRLGKNQYLIFDEYQ